MSNFPSGRGGEVGKYYVEPYGRTVKMLHSKPQNYTHGGVIKWEGNQYNPFTTSLERDNKPVLLEYGSMVVPRPVIHLYYQYVKQYGPVTQPQIRDRDQLIQIIVMPEEAVIPKKFVPQVKAYLKKHGVTLPIEHDNLFLNEKKYNEM
jgi:hypothetical protein